MASELSKESAELALGALQIIGRSEREDGESALPSLGRVLREIRNLDDLCHPLGHLRGLVRKLAAAFGVRCTPEMLLAYEDALCHRTDADLYQGYASLLADDSLRRMPTPGQFRAACPPIRVRRDGSRPE